MSDQSLERYWFRPKAIGVGFTPASWEGWVATLIFVLVFIATVLQLVPHAPGFPGWVAAVQTHRRGSFSDLLDHPAVILEALAEIAAFMVIGAWKTGPRTGG